MTPLAIEGGVLIDQAVWDVAPGTASPGSLSFIYRVDQ